MATPLLFLTLLTIVFLIGLVSSIISKKVHLPNLLLLLIAGILLGKIKSGGKVIFTFPNEFVAVISLMALVLIVFSGSAGFKLKQFDLISSQALKFSVIWLILNIILLSVATYFIFGITSISLLLLFTSLMSGTSPDVIILMLGKAKSKVVSFLEIESIVNTPIMVLIPFIVMDFILNSQTPQVVEIIKIFTLKFVAGIGAGILVGIIIFKFMRHHYSEDLSALAILTATLITFILAENLGGNGVLAVTTLGLFTGAIYLKEKEKLFDFSGVISNILEILVFILVGLIIKLPFNGPFLTKSAVLFAAFLLIRFITFHITFRNKEYSQKEIIFMSLNASKGVAVAVVVLSLTASLVGIAGLDIPTLNTVINLSFAFLLYSIIIGTATIKLSKHFLKAEGISLPSD
jgi:NhaP-type Na+/H+ or K+/H+ antiporter|tara:strand:+ start:100 stop:1311 length:1212 start_codon:yes stop_codon:yes gene_type:complete